jgi:DUF1680 family protein
MNDHHLNDFSRRQFAAVTAGVIAGPSDVLTPSKPPSKLRPLAFQPLLLGQIKPAGWLLNQLRIQAKGLGGHLDEFWPDVKDSAWVGGKAEGWERGPYWLDGYLPLAILLDDPHLKARAKRWIDHILSTQHADGWLGPIKGNPSAASRLSQYDVWPRFIVLKALTQWQEATGDPRVIPAMTRFLKMLGPLLDQKPLDEWAKARWADLVLSIHWLYDRTGEDWLLDVAAKARKQGFDWMKIGREFRFREKVTNDRLTEFKKKAGGKGINDEYLATHGVNAAMGWKAGGVWFRQSNDEADRKAVDQFLKALDHYHGQATGMFTCDEHFAGRSPSQGTETCTVVEAMFSLEQLIAILGDVSLADRLERIAFNALPAAFNADMTARQYDQQANQAVCKVSPERVYMNNGPDANLFGLETNFGCCTANFHQGWPKFVSHLWMKTPDGGLAAISYAPCIVETEIQGKPVRIEVKTEYPFREEVRIIVTTREPMQFPLHLRVPEWLGPNAFAVDVESEAGAPGRYARIDRRWAGEHGVVVRLPTKPRLGNGIDGSVSLLRGPLVYSLNVGADWKKLRGNERYPDWEVHPTTPWNYAVEIDRTNPEQSVSFAEKAVGSQAFSSDGAPIIAKIKGRRVPGWTLEKNAAAPPPQSPVESNELLEELTLVPYGSAKLRITEFPVLKK